MFTDSLTCIKVLSGFYNEGCIIFLRVNQIHIFFFHHMEMALTFSLKKKIIKSYDTHVIHR